MEVSSWSKMMKEVCKSTGDNPSLIVWSIPKQEQDRLFDGGFGRAEGEPFTAYSCKYVYFPICYDGAESIGYLPRNPDTLFRSRHFGGE